MQVVSFHPGVFHTGSVTDRTGFAAEDLAFDDTSMPASVAVWLALREARFLHGRFNWASWDVEEPATGELRQINEDADFPRVGVVGLKVTNLT
ncbi:hypothetical protein RB594_001070 [Gaeumannomyces avenae]